MKKIIISLFFILLSPVLLQAQGQAKIPSGIPAAIKAGNASELAKYMNSSIELTLLDKEDFYQKSSAEAFLKEFFNSYKTKDFNIRHQGARNDALYAIGNLITVKGNFRVYFLLKKTNNKFLIYQIRIETENDR